VAELLLELRHLRERMLEPAVLEQDARVAGEGFEELDVGVAERADVADALADDGAGRRSGPRRLTARRSRPLARASGETRRAHELSGAA